MSKSFIIKNCEPFTMKHKLLFIEFTNGSYLEPRSWIPHDFGGFLLSLPPPRGGDGWLFLGYGGDHGGKGWLPPSTWRYARCFFNIMMIFGARASSAYRWRRWYCFPAKFDLLNNMGSVIGPSCYWVYAVYFWALVQSNLHMSRLLRRTWKIIILKFKNYGTQKRWKKILF